MNLELLLFLWAISGGVLISIFLLIRWDWKKDSYYYRDVIEQSNRRFITTLEGFRVAIVDNTQAMLYLKEVLKSKKEDFEKSPPVR